MPQRDVYLGPGDLWDERPTRAELQAEELGAIEAALVEVTRG